MFGRQNIIDDLVL